MEKPGDDEEIKKEKDIIEKEEALIKEEKDLIKAEERLIEEQEKLIHEEEKQIKEKEEHRHKSYKIIIDGKPYEYGEEFITGLEIKKIADIPLAYGVWLKMYGPEPDKEIGDNDKVDLGLPGTETFFSGPKATSEG